MVTRVEVNDDNCGYKTLITVTKSSPDSLSLNIQSDCKYIKKIANSIGSNLNKNDATKPFSQNIMYQKAAEHMPACVVCLIPCAIIKALWVELGMSLRKDIRIQFTSLNSGEILS